MKAGSQPPPTIETGLMLHRQGRLADAEAVYRTVLAREPNRFEAHYLLAHLAYQRGHGDDALKLLSRALALNPQSPEAWSLQCGALLALDRIEEALTACDRALALRPSDAEGHYNRAMILIRLTR